MSFVTTSDHVPQWARHCPADWHRDWLKWHAGYCGQRPTEDQATELPYISNEDIASWTGKLLRKDPQPSESDGRLFRRDDVLFNKLRPYLAKVYHAEFDGVSSGELLCLRSGAAVVPRFLFYVLVSKGFIDAVDSESFGTKMPRADWGTVGHQPLPLPPLATQRRIARFLDAKTARIDALIAKKRALLERLAEKRQALITQAVTKGLDPNVPMKDSGINWLGQIPAHWDVLPLRRVAFRVATGRTPPTAEGDYFADGDVNWYTPGDFAEGAEELGDSERKIVHDAVNDGVGVLFPAGVVMLVTIGATLGKVAVAVAPASANQQINAILLERGNVAHYLAYLLHGFRNEVRVMSNANTLGILNQAATKALPILRPPSREQQAIADYLVARDRRHAAIVQKIHQSIVLLQEQRAALITAAITGQLEIPADGQRDRPDERLGTLAAEVA